MNIKKTVVSVVATAALLSGCASNQDKPDTWVCALIGGGVGGGIGAAIGDSVAPGTGIAGAFLGGYLCDNRDAPETPAQQAPADTDGDGVTDDMDQCLSTPAGVPVDSKGCAKDSDTDGVADYIDNCPGTAAGLAVDSAGCTKYIEQTISKELVISFDSNKSVVNDEYLDEVKQIADFMKKYPQIDVIIEGHTDKTGSASYNKKLSGKRAKAVAALLTHRYGIDAARVKTVGYGESMLLDKADTKEAHKRNRRIVAVMSAKDKVEMKK